MLLTTTVEALWFGLPIKWTLLQYEHIQMSQQNVRVQVEIPLTILPAIRWTSLWGTLFHFSTEAFYWKLPPKTDKKVQNAKSKNWKKDVSCVLVSSIDVGKSKNMRILTLVYDYNKAKSKSSTQSLPLFAKY